MQSTLASAIGRPDLASAVVDRYSGTSGGLQAMATGGFNLGSSASGNFDGRLTAGVAIVALAVVAGFYLWTRNIQS